MYLLMHFDCSVIF